MTDRNKATATHHSRTSDGITACISHVRTPSNVTFSPTAHRTTSQTTDQTKRKGATPGDKPGKARWLHKMTDWLAVAEPSAQALKHHKKDVFRKAGIPRGDPDAGAKLHVPIGEIPAGAVRPCGPGPDPEDALLIGRRGAAAATAAGKKKCSRAGGGSPLGSAAPSQSSSGRSGRSRVENPIFPFE